MSSQVSEPEGFDQDSQADVLSMPVQTQATDQSHTKSIRIPDSNTLDSLE